MNAIIFVCLLLLCLYLLIQVAGGVLVFVNEYKKAKAMRKPDRPNYIVIKGRKFYPKRTGRENSCKRECPLYPTCERGSHSICMALNSPYEDTIIVEDEE